MAPRVLLHSDLLTLLTRNKNRYKASFIYFLIASLLPQSVAIATDCGRFTGLEPAMSVLLASGRFHGIWPHKLAEI